MTTQGRLSTLRRAAAFLVLVGALIPVTFAAPADYFAIVPCRVFDSRLPANAPALTSGVTRTITVAGLCGVPGNATSVAFNVTVTQPTGNGHLRLSAAGTAPATSTINYASGVTRANNAIVQLSAGGQVDALPFLAGPPPATVHLVLDVFGYFVDDVPPVGQDDQATLGEDDPATTIDVLANDQNPDGGPISIAAVTQPANGTVVITNGGADLTYQPSADYCNAPPASALDTFTYDLSPGTSSATVSVTVNCVNDPPQLAGVGAVTFAEDGPPVAVAPALTATDVDDTNLESATVTIANLLDTGAEVLAATTTGTAITATYVAPTLTLTGTDTVANYQQVLRSVTYENTAGNPNLTARTVNFVANDGTANSNTAGGTVSLTGANDAPVLTAGGATPTFTEDGPAVAVDPGLVATDVDDTNLESAAVTITNLADTGAEVLSATTTGTAIVATYIAPTLSLTGSDTVANYQQVLRSVAYANGSQSPSAAARTVSFVANDGTVNSNTVTTTVNVTPVNDRPLLMSGGGSPTFTEDGAPVAVDPGLAVSDLDDTNLESATVTITNLQDVGAVVRAATTGGTAITASYTAPTLTLSGSDTLANYQQVLRSVTYANSSQNPGAVARVISFLANDGTDPSNTVSTSVGVTPVNDAPVLTAGGGTPTFTEDGSPVAVDPALGVADVDNVALASATVTITNLQDAGAELLAATTGGTAITATYTAPTLTLTGADTLANYQQVLRSVTYENTSDSPSTTARTVEFRVNDGIANSNIATTTLSLTAINDAPVLTAGGGSPTFTEDGAPVAVDPGLTVTDGDSTDLASAVVTITNLTDTGAEFLAATTTGTAITASYVAPTLTLTGTDTLANYQQVLRSVTYRDASQNPSTAGRVISFRANDGTDNSNIVTTSVGVTAVNDPPVIAGTGTVTFTEDAGAVTVASALTVVDVDNANLTTGTVTITNLQDAGQEVLTATTTGTSITAIYAAPTLTLTGADTVANYQLVLRSVRYANNSQNPSATPRNLAFQVSDGAANSNIATATVQVVPVNDPPVFTTNPITYATAGHTQLHVAGDTLPGVASIADPLSALAKSVPTDVDGPAAPSVIAASGSSTNGGTFAIDTDGSFTYVPPLNFTGTDSFTYQVTDSVTPISGTINITVSSIIWYVRDVTDANNPPGGDGRSTNAFETLAAAQGASGNSHFIFVFNGNTATTPLAGGIVLKDGQRLHGEGIGLSVPGFANIIAAGTRPRINNAAGDAVSVPATAGNRNGVEVRGLDLQGTANAVDVTATGGNTVGVTISDNTIRGAGAEGLDLNAGSTGLFTAIVQNNTITSTGNGFDARRTAAGALQVTFSTNTVASNGAGVFIDGSGGGTTTVTGFNANTVSGNTLGAGVMITTATFDANPGGTFDQVLGGITAIGVSGNGVGGAGLVLTNVAGDLAFNDLDVFADGGAAFSLSGTGTYTGAAGFRLTVPSNVAVLQAVGGAAVDASSATLDLRLNGLSSTGSGGGGIRLVNIADGGGTDARFSAPSGSSIATAAGIDFEVSGGNAGITYAGTINNSTSRAVSISGWAGDDATDDLVLSGAITETGTGILVTGNSGSRAITFSGSLAITAINTNIGFSATTNTNTGGLQISGGPNTVTTTNAAALNVVNTVIGTAGLTFRSLSASGGTNGIVLTNTGTQGGLTVVGTGGAGTGGTIQNMTGDGISLTNTRSLSFNSMNITSNQGSGINGDDVTNFAMVSCNVTNNADTATGVEAGVRFEELLGTCAITSSTISGSSEDNVRITPASGVLTNLTISNSTIGPNSVTTGGNGVTVLGSGTATATVTVTGTTFTGNRGTGFLSNFTSSGSHTVNVNTSIFRDNGKGLSLANNTNTDLLFNVLNNNEVVRSQSNALELIASADATSAMEARGTFSGNVVGDNNADSGSRDLHGIALDMRGDERALLAVNNNNVRHVDLVGLFISDADFGTLAGPPSDHDLTVRDNSVQNIDDNSGFPCAAPYGTLVDMRHTTVACLDMAGNTSAESPGGCGAAHFRLRQRDTSTFHFERLSDGDGTPGELINTVATIQTHAVNENDPGSTASVTLINGFTEATNGFCVKP
jgi:hypothetical protein